MLIGEVNFDIERVQRMMISILQARVDLECQRVEVQQPVKPLFHEVTDEAIEMFRAWFLLKRRRWTWSSIMCWLEYLAMLSWEVDVHATTPWLELSLDFLNFQQWCGSVFEQWHDMSWRQVAAETATLVRYLERHLRVSMVRAPYVSGIEAYTRWGFKRVPGIRARAQLFHDEVIAQQRELLLRDSMTIGEVAASLFPQVGIG